MTRRDKSELLVTEFACFTLVYCGKRFRLKK
jgi:hypothetical protein